MSSKPGRNDPCPCGSGKKYKNCCLGKPPTLKLKHRVSVLSAKKDSGVQGPNLMNRAFGDAIEVAPSENLLFTEAFPESSPPPPGEVSPLGVPSNEKH